MKATKQPSGTNLWLLYEAKKLKDKVCLTKSSSSTARPAFH